jgi:hypothetical protein
LYFFIEKLKSLLLEYEYKPWQGLRLLHKKGWKVKKNVYFIGFFLTVSYVIQAKDVSQEEVAAQEEPSYRQQQQVQKKRRGQAAVMPVQKPALAEEPAVKQAEKKPKFSITMPKEKRQQSLFSGEQVRNLFIAADPDKSIPDGDTMSTLLLTVFKERSYPLVISRSLWADFCDRRRAFRKKVGEYDSMVSWLMHDVYNPLQELVQERYARDRRLQNNPERMKKYLAEKVRDQWKSMKVSKIEQASMMIRKLYFAASGDQKTERNNYYKYLEACFDAYTVPFDGNTWEVYSYKNEWFLLIPRQYQYRIAGQGNSLSRQDLGFKVDDLDRVTILDPYNIIVEASRGSVPLDEALAHMLLGYDDVFNTYSYLWDIIMIGHGMLNIKTEGVDTLSGIARSLKEDFDAIHKEVGYVSLEKVEETALKMAKASGESSTAKEKKLQDLKRRVEKIKLAQTALGSAIKKTESNVAGMSLEKFRNFLLFLKNNIQTRTLLYLTCYSGSYNLMLPYLSGLTSSEQERFPFTIIASGLSDIAFAMLDSGLFLLNSFSRDGSIVPRQNINVSNILLDAEKRPYFLPKAFGLEVQKTFDLLAHKEGAISEVVNTFFEQIAITSEQQVKNINIAAVRYANATEFSSVAIGKQNVGKSYKITKIILSTKPVDGILSIPRTVRDVVFDTYYVPVTLLFEGAIPFCATTVIKNTSAIMSAATLYIDYVATDHAFNEDDFLSLMGIRKEEQFCVPKAVIIDNWMAQDDITMEKVIMYKDTLFNTPEASTGYVGLSSDGNVYNVQYTSDETETVTLDKDTYLDIYRRCKEEVVKSAQNDGLFLMTAPRIIMRTAPPVTQPQTENQTRQQPRQEQQPRRGQQPRHGQQRQQGQYQQRGQTQQRRSGGQGTRNPSRQQQQRRPRSEQGRQTY